MRAQTQEKPRPKVNRVAQAAHARLARVAAGEARQLPPYPEREFLFFLLMHHFHTSTRSLLMHAGLAARDFSEFSKEGWIEYHRVSWKKTSRSKRAEISCIALTHKGRAEKMAILGLEKEDRKSKPVPDQHLGHELMLQAIIYTLHAKGQLKSLLGPALIRDGAIKDCHDYFGLNASRGMRFWQFDALIALRPNERREEVEYFAIEFERTRKNLRDQQNFFDKLEENSFQECRILILTETERASEVWRSHLHAWRTKGRPTGKDQYDNRQLLADQERTLVLSAEAIGFESMVTGLRRPSGRGTTRSEKSINNIDFHKFNELINQSEIRQLQSSFDEKLSVLLEAMETPVPRGSRPVNVSDWEVLPDQPSFLTIEEVLNLANPSNVVDFPKLQAKIEHRRARIAQLTKAARAELPEPAPRKKGLFSKLRK